MKKNPLNMSNKEILESSWDNIKSKKHEVKHEVMVRKIELLNQKQRREPKCQE